MPSYPNYVVEPMSVTDIDQVIKIEQVSFPAPWPARAFQYEITENEHSTMLVARPVVVPSGSLSRLKQHLGWVKPTLVVGYAGFWLLADDVHLCTIAVHPQWRGRGLGQLLLLSVLEQGIELGARRATLEVRVSNQAAQGLYLKHGFQIVSRRKRYYADNNEDAYIMATPAFQSTPFQITFRRCRSELLNRLQAEAAATPDQAQAEAMPVETQ